MAVILKVDVKCYKINCLLSFMKNISQIATFTMASEKKFVAELSQKDPTSHFSANR